MMRGRFVFAPLVLGASIVTAADACVPKAVAPLAVQAGCILLRTTDVDGAHEVCATLEDLAPVLAPLVDELVAKHADARDKGAMVAFSFALPKAPKKPARRRCVTWEYLDAGESTSDGGARDE